MLKKSVGLFDPVVYLIWLGQLSRLLDQLIIDQLCQWIRLTHLNRLAHLIWLAHLIRMANLMRLGQLIQAI